MGAKASQEPLKGVHISKTEFQKNKQKLIQCGEWRRKDWRDELGNAVIHVGLDGAQWRPRQCGGEKVSDSKCNQEEYLSDLHD